MRQYFLRRYYTYRILSIGKRITNHTDSMRVLSDIILWLGYIPKYHLDETKFYKRRFESNFIDVVSLSRAIEIVYNNIIYSRSLEYEISKELHNITLDDWLVDDDSYRFSLNQFSERTLPILLEIKKQLGIMDSVDRNYHISNFTTILVTLRNIVEVCYSNK